MYAKRAWTAYSRTKTEAPKHSATAQSWTKLLKWSEFDSAAAPLRPGHVRFVRQRRFVSAIDISALYREKPSGPASPAARRAGLPPTRPHESVLAGTI